MKLLLFSVRDQKGECYNTPFVQKQQGEAIRTFDRLAKDPATMPGQYPEDYDLYQIGEFDDQSGLLTSFDTPKHIVKAVNLKQV